MLGVSKIKYNIRLSGLARMRTGINMIFLDLIILQILSKIFISIILINRNFEEKLKNEKKIDLLKRPYI